MAKYNQMTSLAFKGLKVQCGSVRWEWLLYVSYAVVLPTDWLTLSVAEVVETCYTDSDRTPQLRLPIAYTQALVHTH